jgi:phospholipid-translocating ATPase
MHNKSLVALGAILLSLGAVFLWNIILAAIYPNDKVYHVRHAYFVGFGRNPLWWLSLILIVLSVAVFEFGVASVRAAYFTTDIDVFQQLEREPGLRSRFEDAAQLELRGGWEGEREKREKGRERAVDV